MDHAPTVREHRDQQHEAILDAVGALLADEGYAGVELAAVGERVGLARTSLYRYARHKDELVAQWLERAFGPAMAEAQACSAPPDPRRNGWRPGSTVNWTSPRSHATVPPPG